MSTNSLRRPIQIGKHTLHQTIHLEPPVRPQPCLPSATWPTLTHPHTPTPQKFKKLKYIYRYLFIYVLIYIYLWITNNDSTYHLPNSWIILCESSLHREMAEKHASKQLRKRPTHYRRRSQARYIKDVCQFGLATSTCTQINNLVGKLSWSMKTNYSQRTDCFIGSFRQ